MPRSEGRRQLLGAVFAVLAAVAAASDRGVPTRTKIEARWCPVREGAGETPVTCERPEACPEERLLWTGGDGEGAGPRRLAACGGEGDPLVCCLPPSAATIAGRLHHAKRFAPRPGGTLGEVNNELRNQRDDRGALRPGPGAPSLPSLSHAGARRRPYSIWAGYRPAPEGWAPPAAPAPRGQWPQIVPEMGNVSSVADYAAGRDHAQWPVSEVSEQPRPAWYSPYPRAEQQPYNAWSGQSANNHQWSSTYSRTEQQRDSAWSGQSPNNHQWSSTYPRTEQQPDSAWSGQSPNSPQWSSTYPRAEQLPNIPQWTTSSERGQPPTPRPSSADAEQPATSGPWVLQAPSTASPSAPLPNQWGGQGEHERTSGVQEDSSLRYGTNHAQGVGLDWNVSRSDVQRGDVQRGDVQRGDVQRGDVQRGDVQRGDVQRGDVQRGDVQRGDVQRGDVQRGDVQRGDVQRGDASGGYELANPQPLSATAVDAAMTQGASRENGPPLQQTLTDRPDGLQPQQPPGWWPWEQQDEQREGEQEGGEQQATLEPQQVHDALPQPPLPPPPPPPIAPAPPPRHDWKDGADQSQAKQTGSHGDRAGDEEHDNQSVRAEPGVRSAQMCALYSKHAARQVMATSLLLGDDEEYPELADVPASCDGVHTPLVVGGQNASAGEFPHMAAVGFRSGGELSWLCGGSLISERFVLTAAHCTLTAWGQPVVVRLGTPYLADSGGSHPGVPQDVAVEDVIAHPEYAPPSRHHDIALLRLARPVVLSARLRPACLPPEPPRRGQPPPTPPHHQQDPPAGTVVVATGWGRLSAAGDTSEVLQKVSLRIWDWNSCARVFGAHHHRVQQQGQQQGQGASTSGQLRSPEGLGAGMLCAGVPHSSKDTCQGDSGGPLQVADGCSFRVLGVTSFGRECGLGLPAVYTKVAHYIPWIEDVVWPQAFDTNGKNKR